MNLRPASKKARRLRRNATDAESKLWQILRSRQLAGYKFRRQHPVDTFILDFACAEYRVAIEADGGQHNGNTHDDKRTSVLEEKGWKVLRFWNHGILENADGVAQTIVDFLPHCSGLSRG